MINLIPVKAKKDLLIEYWTRVVSAWLILWSFALFASAGIILPAYVLISEKVDVYSLSADQASQKVSEYKDVSLSLTQASQQAKIVLDEGSLSVFSDYISLLEDIQGNDVVLNEIHINRDEVLITPVSISGVANNRQSLASFRDRLLAEESIIDVDLPISNLAGDKDIVFNIMVTLDNKTEI